MRHLGLRFFEWPGAVFQVAMSGLFTAVLPMKSLAWLQRVAEMVIVWINVQYRPIAILRPSRSPSAKSAIHKLINIQRS